MNSFEKNFFISFLLLISVLRDEYNKIEIE